MLVRATNKYEKLKLEDKELKRIPKEGEEWEVTEERYEVLTKKNKYNEVFVEKVGVIETSNRKAKKETAVKKTKKASKK